MDEEKNELETLDDVKEVKKEYVINITGGGKNREIRLGSGLYNFGVFTFFVGLIIFVGACGYSIYSALSDCPRYSTGRGTSTATTSFNFKKSL